MHAQPAPSMADSIILLDVGSRTIAGALYRTSETRIMATAVGPAAGIQAGSVRDPHAAYGAIVRVIADVERKAGEQAHAAMLAVTGSFIRVERLTGDVVLDPPIVTADAVRRLGNALNAHAARPGRMVVHTDLVEARLDQRVFPMVPVERFGRNLELSFAFTTIDSTPVGRLIETVEATNLPVAGVLPSGLAASLCVTTFDERREGIAVIDIGSEQCTVATWRNGRMTAVASIALGIRSLARDLASRLGIVIEKAERIIEQYGIDALAHAGHDEPSRRSLSGPVIDHAAPASGAADAWDTNPDRRLDLLLGLLADRFDAAEAELAPVNPIVLTGGGSLVGGLAQRAGHIWSRPVRVGTVTGGNSIAGEAAVLLGMATAIETPALGLRFDRQGMRRKLRVA